MDPLSASLVFVCGICSKTYENSEELNSHMAAFHPIFSCCDQDFNEIELGKHFMNEHMGLPSEDSKIEEKVRIVDCSKILHDHDYCEKSASILKRREIFKKSLEEKNEKIRQKRKRSPENTPSPPVPMTNLRKSNRKICSVNIMKPLPFE